MERNIINKVYINPNFKNNFVKIPPSLYEHPSNFLQYTQNETENNINSRNAHRKIYLNPNFKQVIQAQNLSLTNIMVTEKSENIPEYPTFISKSKYSLVANKLPKKELDNKSHYVRTTHTESIMCKSNVHNQNSNTQSLIDNNRNVVPIVRSRYRIVRKSANTENVGGTIAKIPSNSRITCIEFPVKSTHVTSCSNNILIKNVQKQDMSIGKPVEKITKIKLSKYKTVPISYMKKSHSAINNKKGYAWNTVSAGQIEKSNRHQFTTLGTINKNRFKLTRSNSKSITEANTLSKMFVPTIKKTVWQNQSKMKLNKAYLKLNNIPCRLFKKYGKCLRKDYGKCEYLHDKKHVSLCRKFLKGICHDSNCPLSHEFTANKMPTCYFYLKGICTKESCPYLHIKLSDKIKICQDFLRGYCERGDKCTFRHVKANISKNKKSSNLIITNRSSQSKHIKAKKGNTKTVLNRKKSLISLKDKNIAKLENKDENVDCRYYKDMSSNEDVCENIKPTRCKLGTLPSFIQL